MTQHTLCDGNDVALPSSPSHHPRSWVSLYCVLSKGELGFYKDSKGPASGGTHGGEPLLSLHKATSEVASDYKKKKHVFKLQ
jgi:spectrin beta